MRKRHITTIGALAVAGLVLSACGDADSSDDTANAPSGEPSAAPSEWPSQSEEVTTAQSRLVTTYDGGLFVLDGESLEVLEAIELDGFLRINPAGDSRHVVVSTDQAFQVLDAGAWSVPHGDHEHHYIGEPVLTDVAFDTDHPGHVVPHAGTTALFSDGTGQVELFQPGDLADGQPESEIVMADQAHHGVAVQLANDEILITLGDEQARTGAKVLDADDTEIARSEECPGVHGEAMAAGETVVVGCEDGVLAYSDGTFTKIASPDAYGRIGNQSGSEESTVVLGDYKVDPDAELERPERVSLIDTATNTLQLVDLGVSYTFRSLARGPDGEALVLGTDGAIHVIDPATAQVTSTIPVIGAWTEPEDWQLPRPTLAVDDGTAYVTDPATAEVHAVDLAAGNVVTSAVLPDAPNEVAVATG